MLNVSVCIKYSSKHGKCLLTFDTIDQAVLLNRLKHTFGVIGTALEWIRSYLSHRQSYMRWGTGQSVTTTVEVGVPQGPVLGPMLFTLFVAPLAKVTESFDIQHHQYADNTYLYIFANKFELVNATNTIEQCINSLYNWMSQNGLALNPSKSEAIQFRTT